MGREAKILLGLLGLLAGVFCGVLSMKLFVHRPPAGAGPDVRVAVDAVEPGRPPAPAWWELSAASFAAAPSLAPEAGFEAMAVDRGHDVDGHVVDGEADGRAIAAGRFNVPADALPAVSGSRFGDGEPAAAATLHDPYVDRVAYEEPLSPSHVSVAEGASTSPAAGGGSGGGSGQAQPAPVSFGQTHPAPVRGGGAYEVQRGDSWWQVAERAYGDGRFYRALFAWNRAIDTRVSLVPGTRLEIPPLERLTGAWPHLSPR
ncbi:MAG: LysM peptidoglycan-binding domain-containing protein [Planctomycetia bacterium]|jgi:nucleoid-associated protein YgaU